MIPNNSRLRQNRNDKGIDDGKKSVPGMWAGMKHCSMKNIKNWKLKHSLANEEENNGNEWEHSDVNNFNKIINDIME